LETVTTVPDGIGARALRLEDPKLLTGSDRYTSDLQIPGALHAVFVRSHEPHARIEHIDTGEAIAVPGVVAVLTGADISVPRVFLPAFGDLIAAAYHRIPLARDIVRFVGDIVAVVVAETAAQAEDAAELVLVDYGQLPAVVDPRQAVLPDAPLLFPETGTNVALQLSFEAGVRSHDSPVRVRTFVSNKRMAVAPMEGLAIVAVPEPGGRLTLWTSNQMPHALRDLTASLLGTAPGDLRVACPAVGGGFGGKTPAEPHLSFFRCLIEEASAW
jgi:carbon-monoxide dehydrogenase large subunit